MLINRKMFVCFLLLTGFALAVNSQQLQEAIATGRPVCPERCNMAFRCDPYYSGPPVWTIADGVCKLFKTNCLFASTNCHRQNECLPKLTTTSQQICQTKCMNACEQLPTKPVCAAFPYVTAYADRNDGMITFKNQCELDKWSCWNSKAYISVSEGTCF